MGKDTLVRRAAIESQHTIDNAKAGFSRHVSGRYATRRSGARRACKIDAPNIGTVVLIIEANVKYSAKNFHIWRPIRSS